MNAHTKAILDQLDAHYGREYICYLNHENAWQLLIATMLSAQCTDARVNIVTKDLFVKYPSVEAFAEADLKELEQDIRPTGFYHNKAKNIIACCQRLMALHGGEVPSGLEELTALPGVGRDRSGVCGNAIRGAGLDMVGRLAAIREKLGLDFVIVGVGGVIRPDGYKAYREAGANAVMSATGAMWDANLAREIKETLR